MVEPLPSAVPDIPHTHSSKPLKPASVPSDVSDLYGGASYARHSVWTTRTFEVTVPVKTSSLQDRHGHRTESQHHVNVVTKTVTLLVTAQPESCKTADMGRHGGSEGWNRKGGVVEGTLGKNRKEIGILEVVKGKGKAANGTSSFVA